MVAVLVAFAVLVVFEILALRFGADSRDGDDWTSHRHGHPHRRLPA